MAAGRTKVTLQALRFFQTSEPVDGNVFAKPARFNEAKTAFRGVAGKSAFAELHAVAFSQKAPLKLFSQSGETPRMMERQQHHSSSDASRFAEDRLADGF